MAMAHAIILMVVYMKEDSSMGYLMDMVDLSLPMETIIKGKLNSEDKMVMELTSIMLYTRVLLLMVRNMEWVRKKARIIIFQGNFHTMRKGMVY